MDVLRPRRRLVTVALDPGQRGGRRPDCAAARMGAGAAPRRVGQCPGLDEQHHRAGAILTLTDVALPADGTYTIAVKAPPATDQYRQLRGRRLRRHGQRPVAQRQPDDHGHPRHALFDRPVDLLRGGQHPGPVRPAGRVGQRVELQPDRAEGFSGFTNITGSSTLVTLPTAGTYTLTAQGTGGATGNFSFQVAQTTQTPLALELPTTARSPGAASRSSSS